MFCIIGIKLCDEFIKTLPEFLQKFYSEYKIYQGGFIHIGKISIKDNIIVPIEYMPLCKYVVIDTTNNKRKTFSFDALCTFIEDGNDVAGVFYNFTSGTINNIIAINKRCYRKGFFELLDYSYGMYTVHSSRLVEIHEKPLYDYNFDTYKLSDFDFFVLRDCLVSDYELDFNRFTEELILHVVRNKIYSKSLGIYNSLMSRLNRCCDSYLDLKYICPDKVQLSLSSSDCDLVVDEEDVGYLYNNYFDETGKALFDIEVGAEFYTIENLHAKIIKLSKSGKQCSVEYDDGTTRDYIAVDQLYKLTYNLTMAMTMDMNTVYNGFQYRCVCKACGKIGIMSRQAAFSHYANCRGTGCYDIISLSHKADAMIRESLIKNNAAHAISTKMWYNKYLVDVDILLGIIDAEEQKRKQVEDLEFRNKIRERKLERGSISSGTKRPSKESIQLRRSVDASTSEADIAKAFRQFYAGK